MLKTKGYIIDKIYTGESWNPNLYAPLAQPGNVVNEGTYIVAVDGQKVDQNENIYSYFVGTGNRQVTLSVACKNSLDGAQEVIIKTVTNESGLRRFDWIESNRRLVDEMSDGQLAYVYVPNTVSRIYLF